MTMLGRQILCGFGVFCVVTFFAQHVILSGATHCVYEGKIIDKGGALTAPRGQCYVITCDLEGNATKVNCYMPVTAPGCHKSGFDFTKIYPQCCPFNICRDDIDADILL